MPAQTTLLCTLSLLLFSSLAHAVADTNDFLVFEIDRAVWGGPGRSETVQKFKVPLTEEFFSNFKNVQSTNSMGTGFVCGGTIFATNQGMTRFTWWIRKTADHRWAINMWGDGFETVNGLKVGSGNQTSQYVTIKSLDDLDMSYLISYINRYDGVNVAFSAKVVPSEKVNASPPIPTVPVRKADKSIFLKGDDQSKLPVKLDCLFQEG